MKSFKCLFCKSTLLNNYSDNSNVNIECLSCSNCTNIRYQPGSTELHIVEYRCFKYTLVYYLSYKDMFLISEGTKRIYLGAKDNYADYFYFNIDDIEFNITDLDPKNVDQFVNRIVEKYDKLKVFG